MFKIKKYIPDIVVAIILIAGIGLLAYPTIGDYINALHSSKAIGSYVEKTKDLSKEEKENLLREARANLAITNPGRSRKNIIVIKRNKDPKKPPAENTHSF